MERTLDYVALMAGFGLLCRYAIVRCDEASLTYRKRPANPTLAQVLTEPLD